MLFYASLFLFCVAFSAIVVWLYRSMADVGKAAYRAFLPSSKDKNHRRERTVSLNHSLGETATPWGWGSDSGGPRRAIPQHKVAAPSPAVTPWGWKGSARNVEKRDLGVGEDVAAAANALKGAIRGSDANSHLNQNSAEKPAVGWPYREEKFSFAGDDYKVTRKPKVRKTAKGGSKPWGW